MIILNSAAASETAAIAAAVTSTVAPGDLILLSGDLGAGKTVFVKGFADALGVTEPVTSPTFALAQRYEGRLIVNHLDVYRLQRLSEVIDLAIPELLEGNSVTLIEWGDVIIPALPSEFLEVVFELGEGEDDRRITLKPCGGRWAGRQRQLSEAVTAWMVTPC